MFQRDDQRVLHQLFGHAAIAPDARKSPDDLRRLDAPCGVDGSGRRIHRVRYASARFAA
jgi:hypothetical protein